MANEIENEDQVDDVLPKLDKLTPEQIAKNYKAALDSVNLINAYIVSAPEHVKEEDRKNIVERNVKHLEIMVAKPYWTNEDLTPLNGAIAAGKTFLG